MVKDNNFNVINNNIYSVIHVNLSTVILGGIVRARTLDGIEDILIPPKSQEGDEIVLEKKVNNL